MKKIVNMALICSVMVLSAVSPVFAKNTKNSTNKDKQKIEIIKPDKTKVNKKQEKRKTDDNTKIKKETSQEAEGMYETKFPVINSKIEYADMQGEVSLIDCIKLAITHHPAIMSSISNSEIYKSRVGQAWSNYFPTLSAGVSYSRNDMLMTMGGAYARMMSQKYDMYYVPTVSANLLLFDFGKTKASADAAKRNYEASRFDAEQSIETVIYNVKVAYYNLVFAEIQKTVYEDTVKDFELQLKQAKAQYQIGRKAKIDVTTAEYNLGNAKVNLIKAKNTMELAAAELANAVGIPELEGVVLKDKLNSKLSISKVEIDRQEVIIKGPQYKLDKVATVKALVDINNIANPKEGTETLSDVQLIAYDEKGTVIDVEIVPSKVTATIEISSPSKVVPIKIIPKGNVSFGKAISNITSSVESVTIYGDEETLSNIKNIEVEVDVTGLDSTKKYTPTIKKPSGVRYISQTSTNVTIDVESESTKELENIQLEYVNLSPNYSPNANSDSDKYVTVVAKGVKSVLDSITEENVKVYVDLKGYGPGKHEVDVIVEGSDVRVSYTPKVKKVTLIITRKR